MDGERDESAATAAAVSRRGAIGRLGAALAGAAALAAPVPTVAAQDATPTAPPAVPDDFAVVFHAAEEQNWPYVLSNLTNLTHQWPRARVRVVVDGTAVYPLQGESDLTRKLANAAAAGVTVEICPNALREHGIDPAAMPPYAQISLGGVVALVAAQRAGYAYVKP